MARYQTTQHRGPGASQPAGIVHKMVQMLKLPDRKAPASKDKHAGNQQKDAIFIPKNWQ